ncbi:MAG TPA: winged helix-turn-helix domain-containing protein [Anaerolineales bacterium]|nr:winged helix-turn-helix domain-containing protein [Anaerolineales bacterium]
MPSPLQEILVAPPTTSVRVELDPARNILHSLVLLAKSDHYYGLNEWVERTAAGFSPEMARRHHLVIFGFYYAWLPEVTYPDFPAYLAALQRADATALRNKLLDAYLDMPCLTPDQPFAGKQRPAYEDILASPEVYVDFLLKRFGPERVDPDLESRAYRYVVDPPAMQALIVSHLREIWDNTAQAEWQRVEPMLRASVEAFQRVNLKGLSRKEAAELITGQPLDEERYDQWFDEVPQLVFVPSAHVGPYIGTLGTHERLAVFFGARMPAGSLVDAPDLSRAEILVRISALADDTRLRIMQYLAKNGEQRSQELMSALDLSQSAASRHLKQLSATGYLTERRCEGSKCYQINAERTEATLQALGQFLLDRNRR